MSEKPTSPPEFGLAGAILAHATKPGNVQVYRGGDWDPWYPPVDPSWDWLTSAAHLRYRRQPQPRPKVEEVVDEYSSDEKEGPGLGRPAFVRCSKRVLRGFTVDLEREIKVSNNTFERDIKNVLERWVGDTDKET